MSKKKNHEGEGLDNLLTVLLDELDQCREEDRDARNQMLQAIAAGMAALAVIFVVFPSVIDPEASPRSDVIWLCELVTVSILLGVFSYLISHGLIAPLRYYRMRDLERRVYELAGKSDEAGWIELRAAQTSLNPRHQFSRMGAFHFTSLGLAMLFVSLGCVCMFLLFWDSNPQLTFVLAVMVAIPFLVLVVWSFIWSTSKAERWYEEARVISRKKRNTEVTPIDGPKPNFKWLVRYLIYPRPQDAIKVGFVVLGVVFGLVSAGIDPLASGSWFPDGFLHLLFVTFVFDVLAYQARYQWNDIRGACEDRLNPRSEKRRRLQPVLDSIGAARRISGAVLIYKLILAAVILVAWWDGRSAAISMGIVAMSALAFAYERERAGRNRLFVLLGLVGMGYPLRFAVGYYATIGPHLFEGSWSIDPSIVLLVIATWSFGIVFVSITWALEGADYCRGGSDADAEELVEPVHEPSSYHKRHVGRLASWLDCDVRFGGRCVPLLGVRRPLRFRTPVVSPWNAWMMVSAILLATSTCLAMPNVVRFGGLSIAVAIGMVIWCLAAIVVPRRMTMLLLVGAGGVLAYCVMALSGRFCPALSGAGRLAFVQSALIAVTFCAYMFVFISFRDTNYQAMTSLPEDIKNAVLGVLASIWRTVIGSSGE